MDRELTDNVAAPFGTAELDDLPPGQEGLLSVHHDVPSECNDDR